MGSLKSIVLAGAAAFVMIPGAFAADLAPLAPPMMPRAGAGEDFASGWYLRGDVGVGTPAVRELRFHPDQPGLRVAGELAHRSEGHQGHGLHRRRRRLPVERLDARRRHGEYRMSTKVKAVGSYTEFCPGGRCFDVYDADHQASVFLANAYLGSRHVVVPDARSSASASARPATTSPRSATSASSPTAPAPSASPTRTTSTGRSPGRSMPACPTTSPTTSSSRSPTAT